MRARGGRAVHMVEGGDDLVRRIESGLCSFLHVGAEIGPSEQHLGGRFRRPGAGRESDHVGHSEVSEGARRPGRIRPGRYARRQVEGPSAPRALALGMGQQLADEGRGLIRIIVLKDLGSEDLKAGVSLADILCRPSPRLVLSGGCGGGAGQDRPALPRRLVVGRPRSSLARGRAPYWVNNAIRSVFASR